jgi:hypothetical protein
MYGEQIKNLAPGTDLLDAINVEQLCSSISVYTSVSVDGNIAANFEVKHVSQNEYHELVVSESIDPNVLYIVSSESINAYGE